MASTSPLNSAPSPFSIPDFRFFWVSRLASTVAQNAMVVVIGWQVYDLARRTMGTKTAAFQLGMVGAVQFAALFSLTLVAGWTVDRHDRRVITRICQFFFLTAAAILSGLTISGRISIAAIFAVAALLGAVRAFAMPALGALGPNLVPSEILPRAIASNAAGNRMGGIVGPALGGYLYAVAPAAPYLASAALFTISLVCLLLIGPVERTNSNRAKPWQQVAEGLRYVFSNKIVFGAISLDLAAVLLGGATAMLPVFARDILHAGPEGLGHLRAAPAAGAMLAALWFARRPLKRRIGLKMLLAVAIFGVATVIFGFSRWMPLSLLCLTVLGAADMFSVFVRQSLIQLTTPNEMRGRVGAVSSLFISASNELGEAESGLLAAVIGPVPAVVAGGVGAVLVTLAGARFFPALRRADNFTNSLQA